MNMETKLDTRTKPPLSSTKSIDEGFESDPDREHSTDSEQNSLLPATGTFDVVQLTDRDGVHHTQIARRPATTYPNSSSSSGSNYESDNRANGGVVKINPKVTIPRAGQRATSSTITANPHIIQHNTYRRSPTKGSPSMSEFGTEVKPPRSLSAETVRLRGSILPATSSQRYHMKGNSSQHYLGGGHYPSLNNHSAVIQNASSLYTFYPAEGNISLYPSQYGLRYKSSHLNVEEQAPVSAMWTQTIPRHSRR